MSYTTAQTICLIVAGACVVGMLVTASFRRLAATGLFGLICFIAGLAVMWLDVASRTEWTRGSALAVTGAGIICGAGIGLSMRLFINNRRS
jgi:hypothetical protein